MSQQASIRLSSNRQRRAWIDAARAAAVAAVVLFHVCRWHYLEDSGVQDSLVGSIWSELNSQMAAVRMPLLMLISGLLVSRKVLGGSAGQVARSSLSNAYLYVVWLAIYALLCWPLPSSSVPHQIDSVASFAWQFLLPETPLWFIFALALYIPVMHLTRHIPAWVLLAALAVLNIAVPLSPYADALWAKIPALAVFFALGVHAKGIVLKLIEARSIRVIALAAAAFLVLFAAGKLFNSSPLATLIVDVRALCLVVIVLTALAMAEQSTAVEKVGETIGRRTLGIYLLHVPLVAALILLTSGPLAGFFEYVTSSQVLSALYPLAMTGIIIGLCLGIYRLLIVGGLGFLFVMPTGKRETSVRAT